MASSFGEALQNVIDTSGLAIARQTYRDEAPDGVHYPYAVYHDPISDVPARWGDRKVTARNIRIQLDVWQNTDENKTDPLEDPTLVPTLILLLDGHSLPGTGLTVYRNRLISNRRTYSPVERAARNMIDFRVTAASGQPGWA